MEDAAPGAAPPSASAAAAQQPSQANTTNHSGGGELGFDLDTYISAYTGHAKITRLLWVAEQSAANDALLRQEALRIALDESKRGENTDLYAAVCKEANLEPDAAFIASTDARAAARLERLMNELQIARNNLIKESIRMGYSDVGRHHEACGDFDKALKAYTRGRDYCTTSRQVASICVDIVRAALFMGSYTHVSNYAAKAESALNAGTSSGTSVDGVAAAAASDASTASRIHCAAGLAALDARKWHVAARRFVRVAADGPPLGGPDAASSRECALYGALCALASFDRGELKTLLGKSGMSAQRGDVDGAAAAASDDVDVVDEDAAAGGASTSSPASKGGRGETSLLELAPEARDAVAAFVSQRFAVCLERLEQLRRAAELDMYVGPRLAELLELVRERALAQYCVPFSRVALPRLASAFGLSVEDAERAVVKLVLAGTLGEARVDVAGGWVARVHEDSRDEAIKSVRRANKAFKRLVGVSLLRSHLVRLPASQQVQSAK
ncbi:COP9 signalosome complex subunit 1 [Pseudoscourfieldia marina]